MKEETLCKYHQEFGEGNNMASSGIPCVVPGPESWWLGSVNVCEGSWKASPRIPQLLLSVKWSSMAPLSSVLQEKTRCKPKLYWIYLFQFAYLTQKLEMHSINFSRY